MCADEPCYKTNILVRVRDLDHMNHVNNAVYATYMEQARVEYFEDILDIGLDEIDMAVVSSHIEFKRQVSHGGELTIQMGVPELGRTSFPFEYRFLDGENTAATARTVQVVLNNEHDDTRPIPDHWRESISEYENIPPCDETSDCDASH